MTTTTSLEVIQDLPYKVRARAKGKFDEVQSKTFTKSGESFSMTMTAYNGLDMTYNEAYETAQVLDFSNTVLPWKYEYPSTLITSKFCLAAATNTQYQNVMDSVLNSDLTPTASTSIDSDFIATTFGFSVDDTVELPDFNANNCEVCFKVKFGSLTSSNSYVIYTDALGSIWVTSARIYLDSYSYTIVQATANTDYWFKIITDGVNAKYYYSTDGEIYTLGTTKALPSGYSSVYQPISLFQNANGAVTNTDLKELYIMNSTGKKVWLGNYDRETMNGCLYGIDDTGSAFTAACFVLNGNGRILLLPEAYKDTDFGNDYSYLGLVNIPAHTVYEYDPSTHTWSEKQALSRNFTVVGTPTVDDTSYEVSDFSESDYLTTGSTQFAPSATDTWEVNIKFTTGASVTGSNRTLMETNGFLIAIDSDGKPYVSISDGNDNQTVSIDYTLSPNTTYELLGGIDSGEVFLTLSNSGGSTITFEAAELTITLPIVASIASFGIAYFYATAQVGQANIFDGSINMADTTFVVYDEDYEIIFEWAGYE